ncbi:methionyl-tRNA formyltransferase [Novosphingobium lentum]|uniref:methionyl-tRNA formyltransferase n=1 Tax=Novosphingobium lentum TaxID=145287 RepID=UPI000835E6ED|nr:methionyl-tRNA formyltransferase [Novosphingobium lentum]
MRIVFMGTPEFAVPTLNALADAGHEIVAAYSQPPRPAGRGKKLQASPVQLAAEARGIPVRHPESLKGKDEKAAFAALDADVAVVAAYGLILPRAVLAAPKLGCLNVHGSLLPRWRGAAPVQRAIVAGDAATGVTIMQMERGLDTGPMLLKGEVAVDGKTAGELTDEIATLGARLMVQVLGDMARYPAVVQPEEGVTYAHKIDKAEARLDFAQAAVEVERQVRAFAPSPGAFFELAGERYRVLAAEVAENPIPRAGGDLEPTGPNADPARGPRLRGDAGTTIDSALTIACGTAAIRPMIVQRAGRPAMSTADLLRGRAIPAGTRLG